MMIFLTWVLIYLKLLAISYAIRETRSETRMPSTQTIRTNEKGSFYTLDEAFHRNAPGKYPLPRQGTVTKVKAAAVWNIRKVETSPPAPLLLRGEFLSFVLPQ